MKRTVIFMISLILLAAILPNCYTGADSVDEVQSLIDGIVGFKLKQTGAVNVQDWIDGELSENAGKASEWYIIALAQSGEEYDFSAYIKASKAQSREALAPSSLLRCELALAAAGGIKPDMAAVVDECAEKQGIMSLVFALHMLNNGCESTVYTAETLADKLLKLRLADGGWALNGSKSDVDVTAMTLQALAPCKVSGVAVEEALSFLSEAQLPSGDFAGYGSANPESTAQVITALSALDIDCLSDSRFIKNGNTLLDGLKKYRLADGSFCHVAGGAYNSASTTQTFYSLVALKRKHMGIRSLYMLDYAHDDIEAETTMAQTQTEALTESVDMQTDETNSYKPLVCIIIGGAGALLCIIMLFRGKRRVGGYIFVLSVAGAAIAFVLLTDFRTGDGYYNGEARVVDSPIGTVTLSIRCDSVAGRAEHIPSDGIILENAEFPITEGDSVYTILTAAARQYKIHIDAAGGSLAYIRSIENIREFDFGDFSGWEYRVNGDTPSVGCGEYTLVGDEKIEWLYCVNSEGVE